MCQLLQLITQMFLCNHQKVINVCIILFFTFIANTINAKDSVLENTDSEFHLSVVTENWYPFNYLDDKGTVIGSATHVVRATLENAGISYNIKLYPWSRAYNLARIKPNVLIYSIFRSPIRENMFHWVCPLSLNNVHSIYKLSARKDIKINTKEDLLNYSINVTRGTFPHEHFLGEGMKEGVNLQLTATNEANLSMLLKNRVDLIVEVESAIYQMVRDRGLPKNMIEKVYTAEEMNQVQSCMAISKGTPQNIINKIKQSHKTLYRD